MVKSCEMPSNPSDASSAEGPFVDHVETPAIVSSNPNAKIRERFMDQSSGISSWPQRISKSFQHQLRSFFFNLGWIISGSPWKTIAIVFLVTCLCGIGLISFREEKERSNLWTPKGTLAMDHRDSAYESFPGAANSRFERIIFTSNVEGADVATKSTLLELVNVLKVSEATIVNIGNEVVTFTDLCTKTFDETGVSYCSVSSVLDLFYDINFLSGSPPNFLDTIEAKVKTLTEDDVKAILGAPNYTSWNKGELSKSKTRGKATGTGASTTIEAFFVILQMSNNSSQEKDREAFVAHAEAWERQWILNLNEKPFPGALNANVYTMAEISEPEDTESSQNDDRSKIYIGYTMVTIYVLLMLGQFNRLNSRVLLGSLGLAAIGLAFAATMGIGSASGYPFTLVHGSLLLLMFAIGIDDIFVIATSFDRTDSNQTIQERMAWALSEAGFAITITSFTNAGAFFIGSLTKIPALRSFCIWAGIGILFDYIFQATFFIACFTLDMRRREARKMDVLFCISTNIDANNILDQSPGVLARFFDTKFMWLLGNKVRYVVLIIILSVFGLCTYGMTQLTQEFHIELFYNEGTSIKTFDNIDKKYSDKTGIPVNIYTGAFDYTEVKNQQHMAQLFSPKGKLNKSEWVVENTLDSWYPVFREFVSLDGVESTIPPSKFYTRFGEFLISPVGARFSKDFKIENVTGTPRIVASKSIVTTIHLNSNDDDVAAMQGLRTAIDSANVPVAYPYAYQFIYFEQYAVLYREAFQIVFFSLGAVFIMTFLLIGNLLASTIVIVGVGLSIIDILGTMYFLDIYLNSVSVITLSLAVGLTIDSAAHIALSFMEAIGTRRDRVRTALQNLGPPVIHGSFSTFLAVSVLSFSVTYVFRTFFKMFTLIIVFGVLHGVLLVPILLGLIGPSSYYKTEQEKTHANQRIAEKRM